MRLPTATLFVLLAIACSSSNGHSAPNPAPDSRATTKAPPRAPTRATMEIKYQDLPDDNWKHAAELVVTTWHGPLTEEMSAKVVVRPWKSPDGASVPYLLFVETFTADGSPGFRTAAAVSGGEQTATMATHKQCGATGTTRLRPSSTSPSRRSSSASPTPCAPRSTATISPWGSTISRRGAAPSPITRASSPARRLRSNNLAFDLVAFRAPAGSAPSNASAERKCRKQDSN